MTNLRHFPKLYTYLAQKIRVPVILKRSKIVFLDIFTRFDRARRALPNGIY
jgi:hypothetical protein